MSLEKSLQRNHNHIFESINDDNIYKNAPILHEKAISDIGWNPDNEFIIASSSSDTYLHLIDMRTSQTRSSYTSYIPISMLKWHPSGQMIATAHEGDVKIWDIRMMHANSPMLFITASMERVTNLDWSPIFSNEILTSSQDKLIRLWDISSPEEPILSTSLSHSISLASYTPFGDGIATIGKAPDLMIRLWKPDRTLGKLNRIHEFIGHSEGIKSFDFRKAPQTFGVGNNEDYHIISWSKDSRLKVWCCDSEIRKSLELDEILSSTSTSQHQEQEDGIQSLIPQVSNFSTFEEESSILQSQLPSQVHLLSLDNSNQYYHFEITHPDDFNYSFTLDISYKKEFPNNEPQFRFENISNNLIQKLEKQLTKVKSQMLKIDGFCTVKYIQTILSQLKKIPIVDNSSEKIILDDVNITPSPRTCQAIFSSTGELIFFSNFSNETDSSVRKRMSSKGKTIKTYEQFTRELKQCQVKADDRVKKKQVSYIFEHVFQSEVDTNAILSSKQTSHGLYSQQPMNVNQSPTTNLTNSPIQNQTINLNELTRVDNRIHIYSKNLFLPISYNLAKELKTYGDNLQEVCIYNRDVCLRYGLRKSAAIWTIIGQIVDPNYKDKSNLNNKRLDSHPCGRKLVKSIVNQLFIHRDIQTIAIISCILSSVNQDAFGENTEKFENEHLDPNDLNFYNTIRMYYSDILHRWNLDCQRNEILKFVHTNYSKDCAKESLTFVDFDSVKCSICHLNADGLSMVCVNCGHGGHFNHIFSWFQNSSTCATGCGCECLQYMNFAFAPCTDHMASESTPKETRFIKNSSVPPISTLNNYSSNNTTTTTAVTATASPSWQKFFSRFT